MTGGKASDATSTLLTTRLPEALPEGDLAAAVAHVFNSDQTPDFGQMVGGLFNQSSPDQKAALLNQLLGALGPNAAQLLGVEAARWLGWGGWLGC